MPPLQQATLQPAANGVPLLRYAVNENGHIVTKFAAQGEQPRVGDLMMFEIEVVDEHDSQCQRQPLSQGTHVPQSEPESSTETRPSFFAGSRSNFKTPVDLANQRRLQHPVPAAVTGVVKQEKFGSVKHPARPSTRFERFKKRFAKLMK